VPAAGAIVDASDTARQSGRLGLDRRQVADEPEGVDTPEATPHLDVGATRRPAEVRHPIGEPYQLFDVVGAARRQLPRGERLDEQGGIAENVGAAEGLAAQRERLGPVAAVHRRLCLSGQ
jgi:hypothetical protein